MADYSVSYSKVKTYNSCQRKYYYRYVMRLQAKKKSRPLAFGTLVHEMLDEHAEGRDPFELLDAIAVDKSNKFRVQVDESESMIEVIRIIMLEYFDFWEDKELVPYRINGKHAEHDFSVEIAPGIVLVGKIDIIARYNRRRWLGEHKTFSSMPSTDHRWRDAQSTVYIKAMELLGMRPVSGVLWNYIWSKAPTRPKLLKNETLSIAKIDTLPSVVLAACDEHGIKPRRVKPLLEHAEVKRSSWFQRVIMPVRKTVVENVWSDFVDVAVEMRDNHGDAKTRCVDLHCSWCDYEPLCRAALTGSDEQFVMEHSYEKKPKKA